jgi:flagellin-like protein
MKGVSQIVGAVLLIAITVIAAIALYFMINNQQVQTNVEMGGMKLVKCYYKYDTNSSNRYLILVLRNIKNDITGINMTLYDKDYTLIAYNDTYTTQTFKGSEVKKVYFKSSDIANKITSTGVKDTPYTLEFAGSGTKITPLPIQNCVPLSE